MKVIKKTVKKAKNILYISSLIIISSACKKDKMIDKNKEMTGTWNSIHTTANCGVNIGTPVNPELKLIIAEKGYYRLYQKDKKIEKGRMLIQNGLVTFNCSENKSELDGKIVIKFNADSLNIDRNICNDDYYMRFVR
ncbi:MAG: hypothetical protein PHQ74_09875 [Crocinitomicaceae bacterium]|nr:hypothetical protein [Crocinitomicaceae bacterium]